ncbi:hypothetical protein ACFOG5_06755 [Pedobacter fastidiosus]|uniref:hypothetical protein n=1 Tax=Pedobacter fastidiosus TaxID=2765361 RepID=UPI003618B2D3
MSRIKRKAGLSVQKRTGTCFTKEAIRFDKELGIKPRRFLKPERLDAFKCLTV